MKRIRIRCLLPFSGGICNGYVGYWKTKSSL